MNKVMFTGSGTDTASAECIEYSPVESDKGIADRSNQSRLFNVHLLTQDLR